MKKLLSTLLLAALVTGQAFAWGQNGHRAVGLVAEQHLSKKAKREIAKILEGNSLAEVSVWMDDIRSDNAYDHTHDWHWVTIPGGMKYEQTEKNPNGDVIAKIEEAISALEAGNLPKEQQQEYLKYLVHMVGDLHQPLHVGTGDDMGGNAVKVEWFGKPSNLHSVWDSGMIDGKNLSYTELTEFLGKPSKEQVKQLQSTSVRDWAHESMTYRDQVYDLPENGKLSYRYSYENYDLVEQRLLEAGIRLAGILNNIYG
ncbi:S1/P1 nuclease [Pontibacter ummariensis]|uniref:S1/P1 Nuclease n=1 Tax=Pontibacter ummariensis TaxID=1610492 RepID=A0A239L310_9BACT|nr:S1/P1 nuclease [Pontibacter ummariensis]PRY04599.1 S1/P1 nuclease [Pontibacter ummariensis]SNT24372.1 S1/P1 Nuclease [Pontibacter ummariensis]